MAMDGLVLMKFLLHISRLNDVIKGIQNIIILKFVQMRFEKKTICFNIWMLDFIKI